MQKFFYTVGIALSGTCLIHCLFVPISLILVPLLGITITNEHTVHEVFLSVILPAALIAITMGCRKHKDYNVFFMAGVGILVLFSAVIYHDSLGDIWVRVLSAIGSSILIFSHIRNYVLCHKDGCNH